MNKAKFLVVCIFGLVLFGSIGSGGVQIEKEVSHENAPEPLNTGDILFSTINIRVHEKLLADSGGYKLFYIIIAMGDHDVSWNVEYCDVWYGDGQHDSGLHEGVGRTVSLGPLLIGFGRASYYWDDFNVGSFQANLLVDGNVAATHWDKYTDYDGDFETDAKGDYEGIIGETIQFEGYAVGGVEPYTWFWDLGDGNTSTEQFPTHYYLLAGGEYDVTLTVTDANGSIASDESRSIIENDFEADAGGDYDGLVGELIQFEGRGEHGIEPYTWYWDFGDGSTSTEQNPQYAYVSVGNYTATLTVTDAVDNTASDEADVEIEEE